MKWKLIELNDKTSIIAIDTGDRTTLVSDCIAILTDKQGAAKLVERHNTTIEEIQNPNTMINRV
jgi:hypothetical protein